MSKDKATARSDLLEMWAESCRRAEDEVCSKQNAGASGELALDWAVNIAQLAYQINDIACERCHGAGERTYPSTATWRGGVGGAMMTKDVCDRCWGTGREDYTGFDLRKMMATHRELETSSSRRWFEERIGAGTKIISQAFGEIAKTLRNARWPDYWTGQAAEVIANALDELG